MSGFVGRIHVKLVIDPVRDVHGLESRVTVSLSRGELRVYGSERPIETVLPVSDSDVRVGTGSTNVY